MDISAMVASWHRCVLALSTGHTKDDVDHADLAMDELLGPLLTAPVAQLRTFWQKLEESLRADERVPFFVWSMFAAYGQVIIAKASDQAVIELKTTLAREIATLVEKDVTLDLLEALTGALQWRDPETLTQIRDAVKAGAKPRVVGRESCLFLTASHEGKDYCVML